MRCGGVPAYADTPPQRMRNVWCSVHATTHENKDSACHKGDYGHDREDGDVAAGIHRFLTCGWVVVILDGFCGVFSRGFTGAFCAGVLG